VIYREFHTFDEALSFLGIDAETMRQILIRGGIPAYFELRADIYFYQTKGKPIQSGATEFSRWIMRTGDDGENYATYNLSGWFRLMPQCVIDAAWHNRLEMGHEVWPSDFETIESEDNFPGVLDCFRRAVVPELGSPANKPVPLQELWFRGGDLATLKATKFNSSSLIDKAKKPLDERERTTLLCIIGALARQQQLDLSQPFKAGQAVAAMLPGDVKLSARTIGEHLKAVEDAMSRRQI
jgi:hypothetical protein